MRRTFLFLLLAILVAIPGAQSPPRLAFAQGVGVYLRTDCTTLTSPVAGATYCFDQTANALKAYNGNAWVKIASTTGNDGASDNTTAFNTAITALPSIGGTIYVPTTSGGVYTFTGTINLANATGVKILCEGYANQVNNNIGVNLQYTGTGTFVNATGSSAVLFDGCNLTYSHASASPIVLDISGSTNSFTFRNGKIGGISTSSKTGTLVKLDLTYRTLFDNVTFLNADRAFSTTAGNQTVNGFTCRSCSFEKGFTFAPIQAAGTAWTIEASVFEPLTTNGSPAAVVINTGGLDGLRLVGNWHGDGGAAGTVYDMTGGTVRGLVIAGNNILESATAGTLVLVDLGATIGATVYGNYLAAGGAATSTGIKVNTATAVTIHSNRFVSFSGAGIDLGGGGAQIGNNTFASTTTRVTTDVGNTACSNVGTFPDTSAVGVQTCYNTNTNQATTQVEHGAAVYGDWLMNALSFRFFQGGLMVGAGLTNQGAGTVNTLTAYYLNNAAGTSHTYTMCASGACATTCTIITTGGIVTGGTC